MVNQQKGANGSDAGDKVEDGTQSTPKRLIFFDTKSPVEYCERSIVKAQNGIGGSEASVVRLALRLARDNDVSVVQKKRVSSTHSRGVAWLSPDDAKPVLRQADVIVVLRKFSDALWLRLRYKNPRIIIWYHDWFFTGEGKPILVRLIKKIKATLLILIHNYTDATAVCVSKSHLTNLSSYLSHSMIGTRNSEPIKMRYIYNIVSLHHKVPGSEYDSNKLIFFSAAWKGLEIVRKAFREVSKVFPKMRLYIASPDYEASGPTGLSDREVWLGSLTHEQVLRHVANSLCVFYPADKIPETFGLVFAESHAVGTPVLAHRHGSAPELLSADELIDAGSFDEIVERVGAWSQGGRPQVEADEGFDEQVVANEWLLLCGT